MALNQGGKFVFTFFLFFVFFAFKKRKYVINVLFLGMEPGRTDKAERTVLNERKGKFVLFRFVFAFFYFRDVNDVPFLFLANLDERAKPNDQDLNKRTMVSSFCSFAYFLLSGNVINVPFLFFRDL